MIILFNIIFMPKKLNKGRAAFGGSLNTELDEYLNTQVGDLDTPPDVPVVELDDILNEDFDMHPGEQENNTSTQKEAIEPRNNALADNFNKL